MQSNQPRILHLSLHHMAFEVMVTGEKELEFRKKSKWIEARLFNKDGSRKQYDFIKFTNGYGTERPFFYCIFLGFYIDISGTYKYSNGLEVDLNNDYAIRCGTILLKEDVHGANGQ